MRLLSSRDPCALLPSPEWRIRGGAFGGEPCTASVPPYPLPPPYRSSGLAPARPWPCSRATIGRSSTGSWFGLAVRHEEVRCGVRADSGRATMVERGQNHALQLSVSLGARLPDSISCWKANPEVTSRTDAFRRYSKWVVSKTLDLQPSKLDLSTKKRKLSKLQVPRLTRRVSFFPARACVVTQCNPVFALQVLDEFFHAQDQTSQAINHTV